jgi:hypothetical protein
VENIILTLSQIHLLSFIYEAILPT